MAYTIISQNNSTTTLSDGVNTITVPSRVNLTSGNFTIVEVNNNMATLEDGDGNVYRDIPCVATLAGEGGGGGSGLPDQTGHSGEFLTTDGTDASWAAVDALPDQTGNSGKFLTTDGTSPSWSDKPLLNTATGVNSCVVKRGTGTVSGNVATVLNSDFGTQTITNTGFVSIGSNHSSDNLKPGNSTVSIRSGVATGNYSVAIGEGKATGQYSTVINATNCYETGDFSISVGTNCMASALNAIQMGHAASLANGTNSDANTFKVANANGNFEIMSADGTIPTARLTKVNTTVTLTSAGWSGGSQTVTVTGMTATGIALVSPDPTDQADYTSAGIICTAQAADSLTFTCSTTPSADIDVNVVML